MTWVYLDDQFPDHPKVVAAGEDAAYLFIAGLCYSKRLGTEGHIPKAMVPKLVSAKSSARSARLVDVGLWEDQGDEFVVHDYTDWNKPAEARSEAGRKAAHARWHANRNANASESHMPGDALVPNPVPSGSRSLSSSSPSTDPAADDDVEQALVLFVDRKLASANGTVRDAEPWKRKALANARHELGPKARDWLDRFDVSPSQLADGLLQGTVPASWGPYRRPTGGDAA